MLGPSSRSRIQPIVAIFAIIAATELLVMGAISRLPPMPVLAESALDAAVLALLALPLMVIFVLRPMERYADAQREAERELQHKEHEFQRALKKYRSIVENAVEGVYQTTAAGDLITANAAMADMLGFGSLAEMMSGHAGLAWRVYADPARRDAVMQQLARNGVVLGLESEILCVDGSRRWVSENARAVRDASGAVEYYEGTMIDVTERKRAQDALRDSEWLLRESQSIAGIGSYVLDVPTGTWTGSSVLDEVFGIGPQFDRSVAGWVSLIRPDWRARMSTYFAEDVLAGGGRFDQVYPIIRQSDNAERWVHGVGRLELAADGRPVRLIGTIRDITERKASSDALKESEAKFRTLFDSARVGIIVMDRWTFLDCNEHAERLFGCSKAELIGRSPLDFSALYQGDRHLSAERAEQYIDAALDGTPQFFEWTHVRKDGTPFDAEVSLNRIDLRGTTRLQAVVRDVTSRNQAEASLRLQSAALDAAANAIVITTAQGDIVWANPALYASSGYSPSEVVGKNPRELFKSGTHDRSFYADMWKALLAGGVWQGEIVNRRKDGRLCTEDMTITPIKDAHRETTHFVAVKQDITERKQLEQQFLRTQRLESIGLLAGGIAHDLNNVLTPITMAVELLRDAASDDQQAVIDAIAASAQRGSDLVAQILSFSRGSAGQSLDVQLKHLVREIETVAAKTFPKNITLVTQVARDLWTVRGDPTQFHQMLLNLCINARDAMPDGGQVRITATNDNCADGPHVILDVEDNGTGMTPEVVERIFDPFFTTKPVGQGTGLGLSTVKQIVERQGGCVQVATEPGVGTRFRIRLPAQERGQAAGEVTAPQDWPRGHGETILVVDDDAAVGEVMRLNLEAFGYQVMLARDGAVAVNLYADHGDEIALVITDLMMPVMDGAAVIASLTRMNRDVLILAISGAGAANSVMPVDRSGQPLPVLKKPLSREALLRAVRDELERDRSGNLDFFDQLGPGEVQHGPGDDGPA